MAGTSSPTACPQQPPRSFPEKPLVTRVSFGWAQRASRAPDPGGSASCWNQAALKQDWKKLPRESTVRVVQTGAKASSQVLALLRGGRPPFSLIGGRTHGSRAGTGRGYNPADKPVPVAPAACLPAPRELLDHRLQTAGSLCRCRLDPPPREPVHICCLLLLPAFSLAPSQLQHPPPSPQSFICDSDCCAFLPTHLPKSCEALSLSQFFQALPMQGLVRLFCRLCS